MSTISCFVQRQILLLLNFSKAFPQQPLQAVSCFNLFSFFLREALFFFFFLVASSVKLLSFIVNNHFINDSKRTVFYDSVNGLFCLVSIHAPCRNAMVAVSFSDSVEDANRLLRFTLPILQALRKSV